MDAEYIILHCSATRDSGTVSWNAIRHYHIVERGWDDIGYHFGIEKYGENMVILQGRNPADGGAHCRANGMNHKALGVCVVGEYDIEPPSKHRLAVTIDLLTKLCFCYSIAARNILGHREMDGRKTCPGLSWNLDTLRASVMNKLSHIDDVIVDNHMYADYMGDKVYWR